MSATFVPRLAILMGAALAVSAGTAEAAVPNPPVITSPRQSVSAGELINSIGVVTHVMYNKTPYANLQKVQEALNYTGIVNVRDMSPPPDTSRYDYLASHGTRFDFVIGADAVATLSDTVHRMETFLQQHPGAISSIEGMNEINNWPAKYKGKDGFAAAVLVQQDLYKAIKASPILKSIPVYNLTLGAASPADYAKLGDLSSYADQGNAHIYFPQGGAPSTVWDKAYLTARASTLRLPAAVVTETGYTTSKNSPHGVDEATQAKYILMLLAEVWSKKVPRTFIYQLVDDSTDQSNWTAGLGLYRYDWTAKPAATAVHNLTSRLLPGGTGAVTAAAASGELANFGFALSATKNGVGSIAIQKPGGAISVLIWREQPLWDGSAKRELATDDAQVSVLPAAAGSSQATLYDPLTDKASAVTQKNGAFSLQLTDHPLLLEFK
jgi:trimeric autotransporter adhesin